jgi:hypothetical protein
MDRLDELMASYLDGTPTGAELDELAGGLSSHPQRMDEFLVGFEIDQLLGVLHQPSDSAAVTAILADVTRETDPFVEAVAREVRKQHRPDLTQTASFWARAFHRLKQPGLVFKLAGTAAVCAGLIGALFLWLFGPTMGEPAIGDFSGSEVRIERGAMLLSATNGTQLRPGDLLRIGTNSTAVLGFGAERTRINLSAGSEFKLVSWATGKHFALGFGRLEAVVAHQRPFRPMKIATPQAEARVLGTRFTLTVTTNSTRLEVAEGKVRLTRASDGAVVNVHAGFYALAATNAELAALPATGNILREVWTNYPGGFFAMITSDLRASEQPDSREYLTRFETPLKPDARFGQRVRGYIHPPATGKYRFFIHATGNGQSDLYLSSDDKPENKVQIWEDFTPGGPGGPPPTEVPLVAGRMYYIEALHEAQGSNSGLAVRWEGPGREPDIIPGEFLSPFPVKHQKGKQ